MAGETAGQVVIEQHELSAYNRLHSVPFLWALGVFTHALIDVSSEA